jgi:hypothetical protein
MEIDKTEILRLVKDIILSNKITNDEVKNLIDSLESAGYILINKGLIDEITLRNIKLGRIVDSSESDLFSNVDSWIDEYRKLFRGIKTGAMGDKNSCILRMADLLKRRKDLKKEIILEATRKYINTTEPKYIKQAHYFIRKDEANQKDGRHSLLEAICDELLIEKGGSNDSSNTGGNLFTLV